MFKQHQQRPPLAEILSLKLKVENVSRRLYRDPLLQKLAANNLGYRHVLRFAGNVLLYAGLVATMVWSWDQYPLWFSLPLYGIVLFLQALIIAGMMIHAHELSHGHIRHRGWNDLFGILNGWFSFVNFYSFRYAHRHHHRNIGNIDTPEAGAPISPKGQKRLRHNDRGFRLGMAVADRSPILWGLVSWFIFILYGDYSSWLLPFKERGRIHWGSVAVFAGFLVAQIALLMASPPIYLLLYLLPVCLGGNRILALTYMHHAHEDSIFFAKEHHSIFSAMMWTTDRDFGPLVNFFMLNNGYHIVHHLNPQIPYYHLPKASAYVRTQIPDDIPYNYYPNSRFYRDFFRGIYDQRLSSDSPVYQLKFLTARELEERKQQRQGVRHAS